MSLDGFTFEGRTVTARMLKREGFVYSEGALQSALEAGSQTTPALVAYIERSREANKRKAAAVGRKNNQEFQVRRKYL